mgnify:FL=1
MANRFLRKPTFLIFLFLIFLSGKISAEEKHSFSQKLEWKGDVNAMEYGVEIKNADGKISNFKTENTFIEISYPAGDYEWRVIIFDFLGREAGKTAWSKFTIKKAVEPEVKTKEEKVFLDNKEKIIIQIQTEKVEPGAKIELVDTKTQKAISGEIQNGDAVFEKVPQGEYKIKITNPGGLSSETKKI